MEHRKLKPLERKRLIIQHRKEIRGKIRDRIKAVLLDDKGYSYSEIAEILLLDDETIRRHIKDYFRKHKLKPENGGSQSALDTKQSQELTAHLREHTYLYVKEICAHVKAHYGLSYSQSGMTKWIKSQGFRYKKPHGVPAKADRAKQAAFIAHYQWLKQTVGESQPIYFADSVHPEHQTRLVHGWIFKGERKGIARTARQKRINIMGAICLKGYRVHWQESDRVDGQSIQAFLSQLRKKHPDRGKIQLIWDNAGYHRSKAVQAHAKALNIELNYLPPYSPNLNPIERLWKLMHEQVSNNRYHATFTDFQSATFNFLKTIGRKKRLLRSRITDNFQTLPESNFAS